MTIDQNQKISNRLIGETVIDGITIDDADREIVWSRYGHWDESLPADERARIEAKFTDEDVADFVEMGAV